jgi:hypothetical protein
MKSIRLQNEQYFSLNANTNKLEVKGELTGDYVLSIKCDVYQAVICPETSAVYLISVNYKRI